MFSAASVEFYLVFCTVDQHMSLSCTQRTWKTHTHNHLASTDIIINMNDNYLHLNQTLTLVTKTKTFGSLKGFFLSVCLFVIKSVAKCLHKTGNTDIPILVEHMVLIEV